jgi:hypothetical protein
MSKPVYCGCGVCMHCEYGVPIGYDDDVED